MDYNINDFKKQLAKQIGKMLTEARTQKGYTQKQLADNLDTQQPSIARIERGFDLPSLAFLSKIAKALDMRLIPPKLEFGMDIQAKVSLNTKETSKSVQLNISKTKKICSKKQNNDIKDLS